MSHVTTLRIAHVVPVTEAEGPGRRFAIWFQGCPLRCPGCCNPEMLPMAGGREVSPESLLQQIGEAADIEGITLLGGEPFAQAAAAAELAKEVQRRGLSVMVFSGYTRSELESRTEPGIAALLRSTDILVDGPYRQEHPETTRRWIGSANQQVHFLTGRYHAEDARWQRPNTLEIRLQDGVLTVNGFPARHASAVWQRLGRSKREA